MISLITRPKKKQSFVSHQGNLKGKSGLFFTRVNVIGRRPNWPSCMEVSYCSFGFGHEHSARSAHINVTHYVCVI